MDEKELEGKVRALPDDLKREVLDYVDFLLSKSQNTKSLKRKFKFNWEGALSEIRDKFTSVELQHKVLEWR
jgi:hypothetical protein